MKRITASTLHSWLLDGQELALLDAREEGEFGASHLFWAVPCPLSRREIRARSLLPRLAVRVCCIDDGRGLAEQLATWLEGIGCSDVAVLDGGTKAWAAAGYELFSGVNVPSKRSANGWSITTAPRASMPPNCKRGSRRGATSGCSTAARTRSSCACRSRPGSAFPAASWSTGSAISCPIRRRWWW